MSTDIRNYALVTAAYWGFTLTDGALRMLVLLHFYTLGYSPLEIALLFVLYEFFGIVTNLVGGWVASRLGLKVTLFRTEEHTSELQSLKHLVCRLLLYKKKTSIPNYSIYLHH